MSARRVLAGPATLGNATCALLIPLGLGAAWISDNEATLDQRFTWLGIGLLAQLVLTAVILAARMLGASRRRWTTVLAVVIAAAARGSTLAMLMGYTAAGDPLSPTQRILAATVTFTAWMLLVGATVQAWSNYRDDLRSMLTRVDRTWDEARAFSSYWTARLNAAVTDSARLAQEAEALHDDIQRRLRPLSHRLWFGITDSQSWRRLAHQIVSEPLPIAWIAVVSFAVLVWNASYRWGLPLAAVMGMATTGAAVLPLVIGQRLARRGAWVRGLSILLAVAASALVATAIAGQEDAAGVIAVALGQLTVIIGGQVIAVSMRQRRVTLADLAARTDTLEAERQDVATHLHSTVQSRWTAAAINAQEAARSGHSGELERTLAEVGRSLIPASRRKQSVEDVAIAWEGIAAVSLTMPPDIPERSSGALAHLVEEAVANAVRHGRARNIEVLVTVSATDIDVTVSDDGLGISETSAPGLGSRWLDSVSTWERSSGPSGTVLRASLPLS